MYRRRRVFTLLTRLFVYPHAFTLHFPDKPFLIPTSFLRCTFFKSLSKKHFAFYPLSSNTIPSFQQIECKLP
ncbi:hypothetical protein BDB00DRAFT_828043 [Zychaea mexicana]|uniref:uncharacterized protein n=1 Tax=Zychaea mexicana TaxID=64656 RepID=UPI0022FDF724|nr:uncharacterized protein BDB00DRAFT_828043 [Zychaea mexicana]KAI9492429.1 hypothetical protein BDB00DRAFT_828043 [Zychaea mexicana]